MKLRKEIMSDEETLAVAARLSPHVLLHFSCGKDSLVTWLRCVESGRFERILPMFMYLIPDLEFVEESLVYYERKFGTSIVRVPHPGLYRMINYMVFQPPQRCSTIERLGLPNFTSEELRAAVCTDYGLTKGGWSAIGVRQADSIQRRRHFAVHGTYSEPRRIFYPVANMRMEELRALLVRHDVRLPVDYALFGRSFEGIDARFLIPIRDHFPRDYARILEWFPLAELEVFRYEHQEA
jgi:hypothetical protein